MPGKFVFRVSCCLASGVSLRKIRDFVFESVPRVVHLTVNTANVSPIWLWEGQVGKF